MSDDELERRLRRALRDEADRITPTDRWDRIHALSEQQQDQGARRPRWLAPVAAAAAVALIAGGAIALAHRSGSDTPTVASTTSAPSTPAATTSSSTSPARPATQQPVAPTVTTALPAYFVGSNGGGDRWGLYREFINAQVPGQATVEDRARAALTLAMHSRPSPDYLTAWAGTSVSSVKVSPTGIRITLSNKGSSGFTQEQTRLAVQSLVWTAQAAVGKGTLPVTFTVSDGSTALFGTWPTSKSYNRPPADQTYQDLATLWITTPPRGAVLHAGNDVVVKGESCSFEGASQWQLKQGSTVVRSGQMQATSGCPTRGTWQVDLGTLAPGTWTFRAYERDMQSGTTTVGDTSHTFTVK
ncbi:MAG: Gmad2 immunoglobulin-like domain-containing protein [Oryzihumus sp.]